MSKVIEKLETSSQTWTNVTLYQNISEATKAGMNFMYNDKEGTLFGEVSDDGKNLNKVGFVPYRGYYPDYLKISREDDPIAIEKHDKAFTAEVDHIKITVLDGEISEGEMKAYVDRGRKKYPNTPIKGINISVVDSNCVDIEYSFGVIPIQRIRRVTGYLAGTVDRFNDAKQAEVRDRVKHDVSQQNFEDVYIDNEEGKTDCPEPEM